MDVFNAMIGFAPTTNTSPNQPRKTNVGLIAGLTTTLCTLAFTIVVGTTMYLRRKQRQPRSESDSTREIPDEEAIRSNTTTDFPFVTPFTLTAPTTLDLPPKEERDARSLALPGRTGLGGPAAYVERDLTQGVRAQAPRAMGFVDDQNSSQSSVQPNGNLNDPAVVVELMQRLNEALAATLPPIVVESPPVYEQ